MDAPSLLVVVLGLLAGAGLVFAVLGWQRASLARRRVAVLERTMEARRGTVARLAEVARAGWVGETITVRGTVPIRSERG